MTTKETSNYVKLNIARKLTAVEGWIMNGATDKDIAKKLCICEKTLLNWKNKYPEFAEVFIVTKEIRLGELIHSAFKQATGYDYEEDVLVGRGDEKHVVTLRKHQPGNATLVMFMLQNKLPDEYKDRRNVELTGKGGGAVVIKVVEDGNDRT